ncbi:nickel pincer cofactor biosynthesis protein LarC [Halobellus ordinarius]|uniref:nickel pincer cofactor biosynthesis protein LarC n=1 Tax=Halobellus ordinarius TaxID=3075120 RepID=UPI002880777C|nr:nickel pincer cofactor biosynthesis protein LarC [Halobellus sp. ZY16]
MRTLAFDGRMGASGDMLLGALVDAGADPDVLAPVEEALDVRYAVGTVDEHGIAATDVSVLLSEEGAEDSEDADAFGGGDNDEDAGHDHAEDGHSHQHTHSHDHDHAEDGHTHSHDHDHAEDGHTHSHDHDHAEEATPAEGHGPHRTYPEVIRIVESMDLPAAVEADAKAIFRILGEAEAAVHDTDLGETAFHEVGADDAIADVVGVALLLDDLDVERVVTTPLATGGGSEPMAHGEYPIPAPAVAEIAAAADWSLRGGPVEAELLTPTGAAILAHIAEGVETLPTLNVAATGYGAGGYDFPNRPNVLRALVGDGGGGLTRESITVLETNLDDATPEELGSLQTTLTEAGARDVSVLPTTMKKSRPGHLVKVVVRPEDAERVANRLAMETGTLGVREHGSGHRWVADRELRTVTVEIDDERYEVAVKVASDDVGDPYDYSAEYDDALAVAEATGVPVRDVMRRAEDAARSAE